MGVFNTRELVAFGLVIGLQIKEGTPPKCDG